MLSVFKQYYEEGTMRKIFLVLALMSFLSTNAHAFLYEAKILSKEEIKVLTDQQLLDTFIAAKIEVEASKAFHGKAGFNPKEYVQFKDLLGFIVRLHQEMKSREIEIPPVDEWLR